MKRVAIILFRIICIFILIAVVFVIVFANIKRMRGKLFVAINGKEYLLESLECQYVDKGTEEKVTYKNKAFSLDFKNSGSAYGMYEYSFAIKNEEVNITPKISVFKTSWWKIWNINIDVNVYEDDKIWNADISAEVNGRTYNKMFYDIENNAIEYRVE